MAPRIENIVLHSKLMDKSDKQVQIEISKHFKTQYTSEDSHMARTPSRSDWQRSWSRNDSSVTWPCPVATRLTKKISLCATPRTEKCRFAHFDCVLRNLIWWCVSFKISPVCVEPLWPGQNLLSHMNNEELKEFFSLKSWESGFAAPSRRSAAV